jgi:hypothetical protein
MCLSLKIDRNGKQIKWGSLLVCVRSRKKLGIYITNVIVYIKLLASYIFSQMEVGLNEINGIYQPSSNAETKENGAIDLSPFGSAFEL